jgi:DMSO/TMAO reductase YedYZ molybdopterin-dependent catalytic subunit
VVQFVDHNGLIVRAERPLNLEMPFSRLKGFITPNELFYVRCHFPVPEIRSSYWRLTIAGDVETPVEIDYQELTEMEPRTIAATLECAGNNRVYLDPKAEGVQWGLGAVGNASWTGVPLSKLLALVRPQPDAVEVVFEGADEGEIENNLRPVGQIPFARSIPLRKAVDDVLLAYEMNGEPLPVTHGFPVRVIVPGWYAMASVKWLRRIFVTAKPFVGYFQSVDYTFRQRTNGLPTLTPLTKQQIKAQIAQPEDGQTVEANSDVRVSGAAWSGGAEVTQVELSFDSGASWQIADLLDEPVKHAWRLWEYHWRTPARAGRQTIMARATDSLGCIQSLHRDPERGAYMINHVLPVNVEIVHRISS